VVGDIQMSENRWLKIGGTALVALSIYERVIG
jgi:hypothetical protein